LPTDDAVTPSGSSTPTSATIPRTTERPNRIETTEPFPTTTDLKPYDPGFLSGWVVVQFMVNRPEPMTPEQFVSCACAIGVSPLDPDMNRVESSMSAAFMLLGKQDEALVWFGRALGRRAVFGTVLNGVFVNAIVGNIDEARRHLASVRQAAPQLTLSSMRDDVSFRRPQDKEIWLRAFRLAGLPE
jgi:hypothetical protein